MIEGASPALILILGGVLVPLFRGRARTPYLLILPLAAMLQLLGLAHGEHGLLQAFDLELVTLRLDRLSFLFALAFVIAALLSSLFALHLRDSMQQMAAFVYAGAAIGAVLAGDLLTLFVYWELTAVASVFLIWASRTERALRAGLRYLIIQVASGVMLLAGLTLHYVGTGSLEFGYLGLDTPGGIWILLAFGIKSAFPLLHNWLQDAYPEATPTGAVVLSVFTTKLAIYALARGFAGTDMLVPVGAVMALFPIWYGLIENDLRRILAYALNNQLGFMVVGIGIGSELAINGTVAHAFCHIIYDALLFMSMGAVLFRTGTVKASELGGLYQSMPWTAGLCIVGAASISAFPLFSGFISKSMVLLALAEEHRWLTWLALVFASAGVFQFTGLRVPYFAFFAQDSGKRWAEAPRHMLCAMGTAAALCLLLGVAPALLYGLLPYPVHFSPYTTSHVVAQLQLLLFSALAFVLLMRAGLYPRPQSSVNLDSDWIYRRGLPRLLSALSTGYRGFHSASVEQARVSGRGLQSGLRRHHGPRGALARNWPTGSMVLWVTVMLAGFLIFYYLRE